MQTEKEEKTITLTEEQLGHVIKSAIKEAMNELKQEEDLPGNEVDERAAAPFSFTMIELISTIILALVIGCSALIIFSCVSLIINAGFNIFLLLIGLTFLLVGVLSFFSICELQKTKKIEVLSTVFSAIMALSTLLVAIVSAYFAYQSMGGGAA